MCEVRPSAARREEGRGGEDEPALSRPPQKDLAWSLLVLGADGMDAGSGQEVGTEGHLGVVEFDPAVRRRARDQTRLGWVLSRVAADLCGPKELNAMIRISNSLHCSQDVSQVSARSTPGSVEREEGGTHEGDKLLLDEVRVHFDLEDAGLDRCVSQDVHYEGGHEVGHADVPDELLGVKELEGLVGFLGELYKG